MVFAAAGGGSVGGCAGGGGVASARTTTVARRVAAGAPGDPDGFCGPLPAELCAGCAAPWGALGVGVSAAATGVPAAAPCPATGEGSGFTEGVAAAPCPATGEGSGSTEGVASAACPAAAAGGTLGDAVPAEPVGADAAGVVVAPADAVGPPLADVELVCAPSELCATPDRGSAVDGSPTDEVAPDWPSTEPCPTPDAASTDEPGAAADEPADGVEPVDDISDAESEDDPVADDDEESDEEPESDGSATANPGVFAAAAPMPSATATALTRPRYFALISMGLLLAVRTLGRAQVNVTDASPLMRYWIKLGPLDRSSWAAQITAVTAIPRRTCQALRASDCGDGSGGRIPARSIRDNPLTHPIVSADRRV